MKRSVVERIILALAIYISVPSQAYAYLDPATGSMLIQGLIGAIVGALVAVRLYWHRFKAWFCRLTGKKYDAGDGEDSGAGATDDT